MREKPAFCRPELHMDPKTGDPVLLFNGASVMDGQDVYRAFSLMQPVGNGPTSP